MTWPNHAETTDRQEYDWMERVRFEWDPTKRNVNLQKHRVRFEDAIRVFRDPNGFDFDATEDEYGEERRTFIGRPAQSDFAVLLVVYTDRPPDIRRIISARAASKENEDEYYSRFTGI